MRIAVCLSGQPRHFKLGHRYLSTSLVGATVDYFFHLWYNEGKALDKYSEKNKIQLDITSPGDDKEILNLFKPKAYIFEPQIEFPILEKLEENHNREKKTYQPSNIYQSMLYSRYKACQLVPDEYDFLILTRTDVAPVKNIPRDLVDNSIYNAYTQGAEWNTTHLNTAVVASTVHNMRHYANLYTCYMDIFNEGIDYCDHRMSFAHMNKLNIPFKPLLDTNWYWIRKGSLIPGFR